MDGRLLLTGVGGFFLGILLYSFSGFGWFGISYALLISALFFILWTHKKEATHLTVGVLALGILLGALRTELVPKTLPDEFQSMVGSERTIEGRVVADPDIRENNQRLTVELKGEKANTNVLVVAPLFPKVSYGETVRATGVLALPEPFETTGGRVFRYDRFLAKDGVFMVLEQASLEVVAPRSGIVFEARGALSDFKFEGMRALAAALPEPQASLAGGLILGGKQGLGKELLQDFITSGLVHIVVLSGYNVMIVADAVFRVFDSSPNSGRQGSLWRQSSHSCLRPEPAPRAYVPALWRLSHSMDVQRAVPMMRFARFLWRVSRCSYGIRLSWHTIPDSNSRLLPPSALSSARPLLNGGFPSFRSSFYGKSSPPRLLRR
jgi:hypothetical protein